MIEGERKDLAYNYLGVGRVLEDGRRLGPKDYSRTQQLEDIEKELSFPEAFAGMTKQRVTEAVVAAKLSRELERPRHETEGRLVRAIRIAEGGGTFHQKLEAHYEKLCTSIWWFDEIAPVNDGYSSFEAKTLSSEQATDFEFLVTLLQHLVNAVIFGTLSAEECDVANRAEHLSERLAELVDNRERPNNSLEAKTLLLQVRLSEAMIARDHRAISVFWPEFSGILEQAEGLGEFDALRLIKMIDVLGGLARGDPQYTALTEQMAAFVSKRTGEAQGALVLLRRAKQLDFDSHFDMIRLLGRAVRQLNKKEHADELIEALQLLCLAYRSAGLLWAARAGCLSALATIRVKGDEEGQIRIEMLPTVKVWAWIALEMRHLPDFLEAVQLFDAMSRSLPLTQETHARVKEDVRELDGAFASYILNFAQDELIIVQRLPDVLAGLGLWFSHNALLYALGYEDSLRADGFIPPEETPDRVHGFFTELASQPVSADRYGALITNPIVHQRYNSTILGASVEVTFDGSANGIQMAESVLGTMEAYFATAAEVKIHPHTERVQIEIIEDTTVSEPKVAFDERRMQLSLTWPGWAASAFEHQEVAQRAFFELSAVAMIAVCVVQDPEAAIETLAKNDAALERIAIILAVGNSYHRLSGRYLSRLEDRITLASAEYPPRESRRKIKRQSLDKSRKEGPNSKLAEGDRTTLIHNHRAVAVQSVIDVHLWDKAIWHATAFLGFPPPQPPGLALVFQNEQAAVDIFKRWRTRFGETDEADDISVSVVRGISADRPHDYTVIVTSRPPSESNSNLGKLYAMVARVNDMTPSSSDNLEMFLARYEAAGSYVLMPGMMTAGSKPKFGMGLGLRKRALVVKQASEVGSHDIEQLATSRHGRKCEDQNPLVAGISRGSNP